MCGLGVFGLSFFGVVLADCELGRYLGLVGGYLLALFGVASVDGFMVGYGHLLWCSVVCSSGLSLGTACLRVFGGLI